MNRTPREILDASLNERVPDNINLFPRIAAQLQKEKQPMQPRMKLTLAVVLIFVVLAVIFTSAPGVASAMRRMLGFIPGFGMVDQGASIRVLAQPISQTRDGITVSVESAVLIADRTLITYRQQNVPQSALSHDESIPGCSGLAQLRLPDGSLLSQTGGEGSFDSTRLTYAPIPADVSDVTFMLTCISNTLPGKAPENWELPIHFIPAPPEMTVVPAVELATATPIPPVQAITPTPGPTTPQSVVIEKALQMTDKLLFIGGFIPQTPPGTFVQQTGEMKITDATGREIFYDIPSEPLDMPTYTAPGAFPWAARISSAGISYPLNFTYSGDIIAEPAPQTTATFELEMEQVPTDGQELPLNQAITLAGHTIHVVSIAANHGHNPDSYFYSFTFKTDTSVYSLNVDAPDHPSVGGGGGGANAGSISQSLAFDAPLTGKVKFVLSHLNIISGHDTWQAQWSPESAQTSPSLYGITVKLDQFIPIEDGYYLIGHTDWTDDRISGAGPMLKAYDAKGNEVPLANTDTNGDSAIAHTLQPNQWAFHLYGKTFNGPLTLRATQMAITFKQPIRFALDLHPINFVFDDKQLDVPWKTGLIPLNIPGINAHVTRATYIKNSDIYGFQIDIEADPALEQISFNIESGLDVSGLTSIRGGGGASPRDEKTGLVSFILLSNAKMSFPLGFKAEYATINGKWETTWNPPAGDPNATPSIIPTACITLDGWKQAAGNPAPLPAGIPNRVLLSRGALAPAPSLFLSNLDGSNEQGLVFGSGSLSPDGKQLAYGDADGHLQILDIASQHSTALPINKQILTARWSPDGKQIAFVGQNEKGLNIYVIDANGQNPRALTDSTESQTLSGWTPDGLRVIASTQKDTEMLVETIDVATGHQQTLLSLQQIYSPTVSISPDGQWLAFADRILGRLTPGIFIARLDGSQRRLLMQLDTWMTYNPIWSPDGRWLAITVISNDAITPETTPALVNVETCQVIPLTGLNGTIEQWLP